MATSKAGTLKGLASAFALAGGLLAVAGQAQAAATIVINNLNGPGVGFNDTTPVAPIGGNTGTTLGEQRLIAFSYAANIWGATLTSNQPIVINAQFSALTCTAASAVLGSAGATSIFRNFANAPKADTWYSYALANKIAGVYQGTLNAPQINANFNANLGQPGCLTGTFFYLGLDGNHGTNTDFVAVLLHEMGHGLGFQTFTNGTTGAFNGGFPSIWDHYLFGVNEGKLWKDMTAPERAASAISLDKLVWTGPIVTAAVPNVLRFGLTAATFSGPAAGAATGTVRVGEAGFGPALGSAAFVGEVMPVAEQTPGAGQGCEPFSAANARAVNGKFALISRGVCGFVVKVKNAQNAGATGVLIADNVAETAIVPAGLGGSDPTITIPAVRIFLSDGNKLREGLKTRSRTSSGIFVSLGVAIAQYAGADPQGRAQMFAPNPFQGGSSVSHFDTTMTRNQLMEPAINGDLTQSVTPPLDMSFPLLQDIGW
ncbi:MAG: peptidase [Rhizobiales bacterium]|nr:peptidase [Rhizobacter sp.]